MQNQRLTRLNEKKYVLSILKFLIYVLQNQRLTRLNEKKVCFIKSKNFDICLAKSEVDQVE